MLPHRSEYEEHYATKTGQRDEEEEHAFVLQMDLYADNVMASSSSSPASALLI